MPTPVFITFRHMHPRPELEGYAREQVERLHRLCDRIVDCRVILEPSDTVLRVVIELTVPGQRLVSSHQFDPGGVSVPHAERPETPESQWMCALRECFESARRILQDYVGSRRTRTLRERHVAHP